MLNATLCLFSVAMMALPIFADAPHPWACIGFGCVGLGVATNSKLLSLAGFTALVGGALID